MATTTALIMAAGQGTRMRSADAEGPAPGLRAAAGRLADPSPPARPAPDRIVVIVSPERDISGALPGEIESIHQPEADGTGGAVRAALDVIARIRDGRSSSPATCRSSPPS